MLVFSLSTYTVSEYTQSLITDFLLKTHTFGPDLYHGEVFPHLQSLVVSDISFVKSPPAYVCTRHGAEVKTCVVTVAVTSCKV